jgi:hypothetical protein
MYDTNRYMEMNPCIYIYCFAIVHLGAFCIQLGLVQLQLGLILVAICSRRVAIRSLVAIGLCPIAAESDSLQLVPSSCN